MRAEFENHYGTARERRGLGLRAGLAASALLLTGSLIGWSASAIGAGSGPGILPAPATSAPVAAPATAADRVIGGGNDSYAGLVDAVAPAVVTVRSERRVRTVGSDLPDDPLFRQFFGDRFGRRVPQERREGGLGSGVIVRPDGYILTNNHVVDGADHVKVDLTDGRTFDAKVVGTDAPSDLAVLKIEGANLLGVGQTVTMGIVSAKGRATGTGDGSYQDFIQTDAPINQGNSGGALVNTHGELIGVNSQILSPSGGNIGIGFAIPANMAKNVMTQLIDGGHVRRGLLGVTVQPVTPEIARSLALGDAHGALINSVTPGGAAEQAGIQRGDVITSINGHAVKDGNTLRNEIADMKPGSDTRVSVMRDGKEQQFNVRLGELPQRAGAEARGGSSNGDGAGLTIEPLTRETARELGVKATSGLVVTDVRSGSRAADAGLREGDVIEEVDGQKVATADSLRSALAKPGKGPALLLVHRGESTFYATLDRHAD
jgi:serine protease Do